MRPSPEKVDKVKSSESSTTENPPVEDDVIMEDADDYQNIHGDPVFPSPFTEEPMLTGSQQLGSQVRLDSAKKVQDMMNEWKNEKKKVTEKKMDPSNPFAAVMDKAAALRQFMERKAQEIREAETNAPSDAPIPLKSSKSVSQPVFKRADSTAQSDHMRAQSGLLNNSITQSQFDPILRERNSAAEANIAAQSDPMGLLNYRNSDRLRPLNSQRFFPAQTAAAEDNIAAQSDDRMRGAAEQESQKGSFWAEIREIQNRRIVRTKVVTVEEDEVGEEDSDDTNEEFNFDPIVEEDVYIVNKAAIEEEENIEEEVIEDEVIEDEVIEDEVIEDEVIEDEIIEDEAIEDEVIEDEVIEDEVIEDEAIEDEAIENEVIDDEVIEEEVIEAEDGGEENVERPDDVIGNILDLSSPHSNKYSSPLTTDGADDRARHNSIARFKDAEIKSRKRSFDEYSENSESMVSIALELNASPPSKRVLYKEDDEKDAADEIEAAAEAATMASTLEPEETGVTQIPQVDQGDQLSASTTSSRRYPARENRGKKGVSGPNRK
jgi:hypothetical protein